MFFIVNRRSFDLLAFDGCLPEEYRVRSIWMDTAPQSEKMFSMMFDEAAVERYESNLLGVVGSGSFGWNRALFEEYAAGAIFETALINPNYSMEFISRRPVRYPEEGLEYFSWLIWCYDTCDELEVHFANSFSPELFGEISMRFRAKAI